MTEVAMHTLRYLRNPDVDLREEGEDGGLLYSPDTNQIRVLNASGLCIWELCDGSRDLAGLTGELSEAFDGVPHDDVHDHVLTFMNEMLAHGFIGTTEG